MPDVRNTLRFEVADGTTSTHAIQQRIYTQVTTSSLVNDTTQLVGTTHEQLVLGDATDDLFARIENLSGDETVEIGIDDSSVFVSVITIPPGAPPAILPMLSTAADVYLKASDADTPVRVTIAKLVDPV